MITSVRELAPGARIRLGSPRMRRDRRRKDRERAMRTSRLAFVVVAALVGSSAASCNYTNEQYCCTSPECADTAAGVVACGDSDRPFCDEDGEYPASDGIGHSCIPDPLSSQCGGPERVNAFETGDV